MSIIINLNKKSLIKWFESLEFQKRNYYLGWHWERLTEKEHTDRIGSWFYYQFKQFKNGKLEISHIITVNKFDNTPLTKFEIRDQIKYLNKIFYGY